MRFLSLKKRSYAFHKPLLPRISGTEKLPRFGNVVQIFEDVRGDGVVILESLVKLGDGKLEFDTLL